jgi:hypothetical protein
MSDQKTEISWGARLQSVLGAVGRIASTPHGVAALLGILAVSVFLGTLWFGTRGARTFTADVFDAVAWPLALLAVVLLFFRPLGGLIDRAKSSDSGGVKGELRESFRKLANQAAPLLEEVARDTQAFPLDAMLIELDAPRSPKQAILDAWSVVERSLRDLVWLKSHTQPPRTFKGLDTRVREEKLLPGEVCDAVGTLRGVFRTARSVGESDIPQHDADDYHRYVSVVVSAVNAEIQKARASHGGE